MITVSALCPDGQRRAATTTAEPDTFFSVPARVHANGTTVTGFITTDSVCSRCYKTATSHDCRRANGSYDFANPLCADGEPAIVEDGVYLFHPYKYRKNWRLVSPEGSTT